MFEFKINNTHWTIEEKDKEQMRLKADNDYTMGLTCYIEQKIYLLKDQANLIKSLKHELTHVWLYEYGHAQNDNTEYNYEDICEIVASSNDFINEVVKKYKEKENGLLQ